jgi:hypothetical protein
MLKKLDIDLQDVPSFVKELTAEMTATQGTVDSNGGTVTANFKSYGALHQAVFTLTDTPITLTDEGGVGQYGSVKLIDLPAGLVLFLGAVVDATLTLTEAAWIDNAAGDVGLGTSAVTDGNALATTEQNIIPTTEIAAMTSQAGPIDCKSAAGTDSSIIVDGTSTALDIYLNVRIDDNAAHATGSGTITGTVTVTWVHLGDN